MVDSDCPVVECRLLELGTCAAVVDNKDVHEDEHEEGA